MADTTQVLSLLLTARYVGAPAFNAMARDLDTLASNTATMRQKVAADLSLVGSAMLGVGLAVGAGIAYTATQAAQFESSINRLVATGAIASNQAHDTAAAFQRVADQYGTSSKTIADSQYLMLSQFNGQGYGISAGGANYATYLNRVLPAIGAFITMTGRGGQVGGVTWQSASQDLPHLAAAYGITDLNALPAFIAQTGLTENRSGLTAEQLTAMQLRASTTVGALGISPAETLAVFGALGTRGDSQAKAGTELASGLRYLLTGRGQGELSALGLSSSGYFKNGHLDLIGLLGGIQGRLAGMGPQQRLQAETKLFGAVGLRSLGLLVDPLGQSLMKGNVAAFGSDPVATMLRIAADQTNTLAAQFDRMRYSLLSLSQTIGGAFLTPLKSFFRAVADVLDRANTFFESKTGQAILAKVGGPLLAGTGLLIGGGLALKGVSFGIGHFEQLSALLPVLPQIAGAFLLVAGAVAAGVFIWQNYRSQVLAVWSMIKNTFIPVFKQLKQAVQNALKTIGDAWASHKKQVDTAMKALFQAILQAKPVLKDIAQFLGDALKGVIDFLTQLAVGFIQNLPKIINFFTSLVKHARDVENGLRPAFTFLRKVALSVIAQISQAWSKHSKEITTALKGLGKAIQDSGPFFQVLGAIAVGIIALIMKVIGYLVSAFIAALPYIINTFSSIFKFLGDLGNFIQAVFQGKWGQAWKYAQQASQDAWSAIQNNGMALWSFLSSIFTNIWKDISPALQSLWRNITAWFGNLGKSVQTAFTNALSGLGDAIKNAVLGAIRWALSSLPSGPVTQAALNAMGLGRVIGHNAAGGYINSTMLSWVGEKGPELVLLPGGSRVYSHQDSLNLASPLGTSLHTPLHSTWKAGASGQPLSPLREELTGLVDAVKALAPQRSPAEEYFFARNVQREREAVWTRYPNTSREFDQTYRKAYQYYG